MAAKPVNGSLFVVGARLDLTGGLHVCAFLTAGGGGAAVVLGAGAAGARVLVTEDAAAAGGRRSCRTGPDAGVAG